MPWALCGGAVGAVGQRRLHDTALLADTLRTRSVTAGIHFAALANVGEAVGDPEAYYRTNVLGSLSLLSAMREAGISSLVFSSTCAVYGIPARVPIDESTPLMPVNPYGETKLAVENPCTGTGRPTACAAWRCGILTQPAPRSMARSANATIPRRT